MRALLYARFSSDQQNPRSAADQLAALRQALAARGWVEVAAFEDAGISGAALATRPGVQALVARAMAGGVDVVLVEALDRLSRSQADTARLYELLTWAGVRLETLSSGQISELHVGLEGTMNRLFLVELGKKTRRGLAARVKAGFSAGGRCYGYQITAKGVLTPDAAESAVVNRIFQAYAGGASPRAIAARLNAEGVPGPRGRQWTASTINGDRRAGDGILHQELYVGVRVFGRRRFRKHPETGRRSSVLTPEAEWLREPAPQLRILPDDLWRAVQDQKRALSVQPAHQARAPRRLLSGLLRCGLCGGGLVLVSAGARARPGLRRLACSTRRERGACVNNAFPLVQDVEARVLAAVRDRLLAPDLMAEMVRTFHQETETRRRAATADQARLQAELAELERRKARTWESFDAGHLASQLLGERLAQLDARAQDVRRQLDVLAAADAGAPAITLHPAAPALLRDLVANLAEALEGDDAAEARDALRPLIHHVTVTPGAKRGQYDVTLTARTAALLAPQGKTPPGGPGGAGVVTTLGAGARLAYYDDSPLMEVAA